MTRCAQLCRVDLLLAGCTPPCLGTCFRAGGQFLISQKRKGEKEKKKKRNSCFGSSTTNKMPMPAIEGCMKQLLQTTVRGRRTGRFANFAAGAKSAWHTSPLEDKKKKVFMTEDEALRDHSHFTRERVGPILGVRHFRTLEILLTSLALSDDGKIDVRPFFLPNEAHHGDPRSWPLHICKARHGHSRGWPIPTIALRMRKFQLDWHAVA